MAEYRIDKIIRKLYKSLLKYPNSESILSAFSLDTDIMMKLNRTLPLPTVLMYTLYLLKIELWPKYRLLYVASTKSVDL